MVLAARVLAATADELFHNPRLIAAAQKEFQERRVGKAYQPLILPNQPPPLDYRNPPRRAVSVIE